MGCRRWDKLEERELACLLFFLLKAMTKCTTDEVARDLLRRLLTYPQQYVSLKGDSGFITLLSFPGRFGHEHCANVYSRYLKNAPALAC